MAFPLLVAQWQMCVLYAVTRPLFFVGKIESRGRPNRIVKAMFIYADGVIFLITLCNRY